MYEFPSALLIQLIFERCTGTDKGRFMGLKEIYIRRVVEREHENLRKTMKNRNGINYYRFTQPDVMIPIQISTDIRMNRRHIRC